MLGSRAALAIAVVVVDGNAGVGEECSGTLFFLSFISFKLV